jgi:kynureninase
MNYRRDENFALELDADDPLRSFRDDFHCPRRADGRPLIYFCGHSLGLQPRSARACVDQVLNDWAERGVEAHFDASQPWYAYHEILREPGARLVGARPGEVVMMNSLTVNLHLMLTAFYPPAKDRSKILIDTPAFPSDLYALQSQARLHGHDPADALIQLRPRPGEHSLRSDDIFEVVEKRGGEIGLVFLNGVNFYTGQFFAVPEIAACARKQGCVFGLDLAHAAGNVPLRLHDWHIDFAVWCNYKYLNAGPGAVGGCFVHETQGGRLDLPRLAGWWGNDPATRFQMPDHFVPRPGADGWQLSNPAILALAPLRASLDLFDRAGLPALRAKSERLTGYLEYLLEHEQADGFEIITPEQRGCQLSILLRDRPGRQIDALRRAGVICDFREPNVLRVAPVPLYNTFHEVWSFARIFHEAMLGVP